MSSVCFLQGTLDINGASKRFHAFPCNGSKIAFNIGCRVSNLAGQAVSRGGYLKPLYDIN